jgi:hypothetical protein
MDVIENVKMIVQNMAKKLTRPKCKKSLLSVYEKSAGFNLTTACGSRNFNNFMGQIFEQIAELSKYYQVSKYKGYDGILVKGLPNISVGIAISICQIKSRYNTMKGSMATSEIGKQLEIAIEKGYSYKLFVMTDVSGLSRNISLHEAPSLSKIANIKGYDPNKHRWISGINVYKELFDKNAEKVLNTLLSSIAKIFTT